jgi:hypothetical protein
MTEPIGIQARTWTIMVPFAGKWMTANDRTRPIAAAGIIRDWRQAVFYACTEAKLPKGLVTPVRIHLACWHVGRAPVRDRANLAPTVKAIVDALTPARGFVYRGQQRRTIGYGLIPDDSDKHVVDTTWVLVPGIRPRVDLTITEVLDAG